MCARSIYTTAAVSPHRHRRTSFAFPSDIPRALYGYVRVGHNRDDADPLSLSKPSKEYVKPSLSGLLPLALRCSIDRFSPSSGCAACLRRRFRGLLFASLGPLEAGRRCTDWARGGVQRLVAPRGLAWVPRTASASTERVSLRSRGSVLGTVHVTDPARICRFSQYGLALEKIGFCTVRWSVTSI